MSNLVFPLSAVGAKIISREPYLPVQVDPSAGGKEARWSYLNSQILRYRVAVEALRPDTRLDFQQVLGHFESHFGGLDSFLIEDETDYTQTDHGFGVGDGSTTTFQLQRSMLGQRTELGLGGPYATSSKPRTNLCLQSQTFDNASWTKYQATITADGVAAPDGTKTADRIVESAVNDTHYASQAVNVTSGISYVFSFFAKADTRTQIAAASSLGGGSYCFFDLAAGTATSGTTQTAAITECSGGWYRCEVRYTATSTAAATHYIGLSVASVQSYAGDGASGAYIWGAQVEAASASTKYIPTTTTALTSTPAYWPSYTDGFSPIDVPDLASMLIYKDGALKTLTTDYSISATGLVTMASPPAAAAVLSFTGNYYKRVRFEGQGMVMERLGQRIWNVPTIDLVGVRSVT